MLKQVLPQVTTCHFGLIEIEAQFSVFYRGCSREALAVCDSGQLAPGLCVFIAAMVDLTLPPSMRNERLLAWILLGRVHTSEGLRR